MLKLTQHHIIGKDAGRPGSGGVLLPLGDKGQPRYPMRLGFKAKHIRLGKVAVAGCYILSSYPILRSSYPHCIFSCFHPIFMLNS